MFKIITLSIKGAFKVLAYFWLFICLLIIDLYPVVYLSQYENIWLFVLSLSWALFFSIFCYIMQCEIKDYLNKNEL